MKRFRTGVIAIIAALLLASSVRLARADTSSGDEGALLLWFGCAGISAFNVGALVFTHGSKELGVAGAVLGATLFTYSLIDDDVEADGDQEFLMGSALATVFIGAMSYLAAKKSDREILGFNITPSIHAGAAGLQLSYNW